MEELFDRLNRKNVPHALLKLSKKGTVGYPSEFGIISIHPELIDEVRYLKEEYGCGLFHLQCDSVKKAALFRQIFQRLEVDIKVWFHRLCKTNLVLFIVHL